MLRGESEEVVASFRAKSGVYVIKIQKSEDVLVYPNPNNGEITIELNDMLNNASYELFDLLGNKLKSGNLDATKSHLNLTIHKGFFVLKISNNGKQFIKKIQVL